MADLPKIALVGSRGIPARYGGNEAITEELARKLTEMGFRVCVTCEVNRFFKDEYAGVTRLGTPSVQGKTLTIPTVNNLASTFHLLLRCPDIDIICYTDFDVTVGALIPRLLGKKIMMNTGGIEWRRPIIRRRFLPAHWKLISVLATWYMKFLEWSAVKFSHVVIADARAIKEHLEATYGAKNVSFIPYGARHLIDSDIPVERERDILSRLSLSGVEYYLTVGRIVAENNMHVEIEGFKRSTSNKRLVIVGNFNDKDRYSRYLSELRGNNPDIVFVDPIYDREELGVLRKNCFAYIHTAEVGGTNPTLLEQMLFGRPILAHDVTFHREVLQAGGIYFGSPDELAECITKLEGGEYDVETMGRCQIKRIDEEYNWDNVAHKYKEVFSGLLGLPPAQTGSGDKP